MKVTKLTFIALAIIFHAFGRCQCLRCRSDDGPTDDELRKIARTCMHRVGENETDSDSEEDNSENNSSQDNNNNNNNNGHSKDGTNNNRQYNNGNHHGFNFQSEYQNDPYGNMGNIQTYQGRNGYMYNNWNSQNSAGQMNGMSYGNDNYNPQNTNNRNQFDPRYGNGNTFNTGNYNSFANRSNYRSMSNNNNNFNTNNNDNQTQQDRACLMHCFFHELKMTNNEDLPDQRKMLYILTMDIRNHEVKQFYVNSIQDCFHLVDNMDNYNRRKDKCDVAYKLVTCLSERAKTNCDDYQNDMMMF